MANLPSRLLTTLVCLSLISGQPSMCVAWSVADITHFSYVPIASDVVRQQALIPFVEFFLIPFAAKRSRDIHADFVETTGLHWLRETYHDPKNRRMDVFSAISRRSTEALRI